MADRRARQLTQMYERLQKKDTVLVEPPRAEGTP